MAEDLEICDDEIAKLITDEQFDFQVPFSPDVSHVCRRTVVDESSPKLSQVGEQQADLCNQSPLSDTQLAEIFIEASKVVQHIDSCMSPVQPTRVQHSNIVPLVSKLRVTSESLSSSVTVCSANSPLVDGVNEPSCYQKVTPCNRKTEDTTLCVSNAENFISCADGAAISNETDPVVSSTDIPMTSDQTNITNQVTIASTDIAHSRALNWLAVPTDDMEPTHGPDAKTIVSPNVATCNIGTNLGGDSGGKPSGQVTDKTSTNKTGLRRIPSIRRKPVSKASNKTSPKQSTHHHPAPGSEAIHTTAGSSTLLRIPSLRRRNVEASEEGDAKRKKPEDESMPVKCKSMLKRIPSLRRPGQKCSSGVSGSTQASSAMPTTAAGTKAPNSSHPPKIGQKKLEVPSGSQKKRLSYGESCQLTSTKQANNEPQHDSETTKVSLVNDVEKNRQPSGDQSSSLAKPATITDDGPNRISKLAIKKPMTKLQLMRGQRAFRKGRADSSQIAKPSAEGLHSTGPMKAVLPVTRLTVPTATVNDVIGTTPVKQFDKLKQSIHGLLTPPRHSSSTSAASVTPGVSRHLSMLPTPNKASATPRSYTSADSQSSADSVWSTPSQKRCPIPAFNALGELNGVDQSTPSCLKSHKPPVQHTPQNKENRQSIWSPVPRPKPINLEHEAIRCTKRAINQ